MTRFLQSRLNNAQTGGDAASGSGLFLTAQFMPHPRFADISFILERRNRQ